MADHQGWIRAGLTVIAAVLVVNIVVAIASNESLFLALSLLVT